MYNSTRPVFVRGLSRSGGTFHCTILDAHPDLAISYELYPNLLQLKNHSTYKDKLSELIYLLNSSKSLKRISIDKYPNERFRIFVLRLERGGITQKEVASLLNDALHKGFAFNLIEQCDTFVEMCCRMKMNKEKKIYWGAKMLNCIERYISRWPDMKCLDVVRDVRDVAASQIQLGTFGKSVEEIAKSWNQTHRKFLRFQDSHPNTVKVIKYEDTIKNPQKQLQDICMFLEIEYDDRMLNYEKEDLTLFQANHISKENITEGINKKSIGKWKNILMSDDVEKISLLSNELMNYFDYR